MTSESKGHFVAEPPIPILLVAASNYNEVLNSEFNFEPIIESAVNTFIAEIKSRFSEKKVSNQYMLHLNNFANGQEIKWHATY